MAATTIFELVERNAAERPAAIYALDAGGDATLTFAELALSCRGAGAWLHEQGLDAGDTLSVVMPNSLACVQLLLGAMHAGICVNPVNLLAQPSQMRHVLEHSDCKLVAVAPEWEAIVRELLAQIARPIALAVIGIDGVLHLPSAVAHNAAPPSSDATALLMYTSGTTGVPKGVMLTQASLAANAHAITVEHALTPADRVLAVLPLYHINGFVVTMLGALAHSGSLAVAPKFSAARFWDQVSAFDCTWINVVPTIISYLLEGAAASAPLVRFCRSASAALSPEHLHAFEARFDIGVIETMGLTETAAPSFSNPLDTALRKRGSVGRASGCEACVIDAKGRALADGMTGEVAIRGPNVMRGYYKDEEATRASFTPDGWLRTGDLGHRDADGFFFVTGRIKELIIKGGENIAPREIDEALLRHPAVRDAAAVGIPDRHYGQEIMAAVVLRDGMACSKEELRAHCLVHLGGYKTPVQWRFITELPRGPSGKVQRLKLLDLPG